MKVHQTIFSKGYLSTVALSILVLCSAFSFSGTVSSSSPKHHSNHAGLVISNLARPKRAISYNQWANRFDENNIIPHLEKPGLRQRQSAFDRLVMTQLLFFSKRKLSVDLTTFFQVKTIPSTGSEDYLEPSRG